MSSSREPSVSKLKAKPRVHFGSLEEQESVKRLKTTDASSTNEPSGGIDIEALGTSFRPINFIDDLHSEKETLLQLKQAIITCLNQLYERGQQIARSFRSLNDENGRAKLQFLQTTHVCVFDYENLESLSVFSVKE